MNKPAKKSHKISISAPSTMNLMDRDYGLMKVSQDKSSTPYPRSSKGVDPEVLRSRLDSEHKDSFLSVGAASEVEPIEDEIVGSPSQRISYHKAPMHINQNISKNLTHHKAVFGSDLSTARSVSISKFAKKAGHSNRGSTTQYLSVGTPHPKQRIVLNPSNLLRRLTEIRSHEVVVAKREKKVSFNISSCSLTAKTSESSSRSRKDGLSFAERRRLFHLAEFTIAKNGKKLCDWPLSEDWQLFEERDSLYLNAEKARDEMEQYLRKRGITKSIHNIVTGPMTAFHRGSTVDSIRGSIVGTTPKEMSSDPNIISKKSFVRIEEKSIQLENSESSIRS
ncbi:LOW QUALITY PROTEIN: uncharacterized protein LOC133837026 [Drosophila sulfurigaster albostrigata]|uniref:LOW QUALITY PROTEIN: uncharacterized protein LOC133837026 n=1 Tax=Drosophila sulfurigaster albostrigata TaxID=89887 RepID=UPI002D2194C9|nr:LOW QUALITY PROTEIN: uncharacterized protein LOC133837026 [Drosophila sulfurigaster albostrigata]